MEKEFDFFQKEIEIVIEGKRYKGQFNEIIDSTKIEKLQQKKENYFYSFVSFRDIIIETIASKKTNKEISVHLSKKEFLECMVFLKNNIDSRNVLRICWKKHKECLCSKTKLATAVRIAVLFDFLKKLGRTYKTIGKDKFEEIAVKYWEEKAHTIK